MKIITGMHRSGTSAAARLFYEAGIEMGSRETFYPPDFWNPEGYFEQKDIHAVNIPLINGPWGKLSYLNLPSEETILKRAEKISGKIKITAQKYQDKVVKENRFCLTLNAWRAHGASISKILVCLREPLQTVQSLSRRNWIPVSYGLNLWQVHYERLFRQCAGIPLWFIRYERLLDENHGREEIMAAFDFLGYSLKENDVTRIWKRAIKPEMQHHPNAAGSYPAKVDALWRELCERHRKQWTA